MSITMITKSELLTHWLGHRALTRQTIEKFPEKELFEFAVGGMRPFSELVKEFLALTGALKQIIGNEPGSYSPETSLTTKQDLLKRWDEETPKISTYFEQLLEDRLH